MSIKSAAVAIMLTLALSLTGCATPQQAQQNEGALIGTGVGAAAGGIVGGVIGYQSGHTAEGVVIGSLIGGLTGAAVGHYAYDQRQTEVQAQQQYAYNYNQAQANLVRLETVRTSPTRVMPGDTVELAATYTVLGPQGSVMDVTEIREVRHDGALEGRPQISVQRQGGTYDSRMPLILPSNSVPGTYMVTTTIQCGGSSDTRESTFVVQ